jgi:transmembrane sensor
MHEGIYDIIAKYLSNEATDADLQLLNQWLQDDPLHAQELETIKESWQASDKMFNCFPACNVAAAWEKISARICPASEKEHKKTVRLTTSWYKYAAGVAAVLLVGFFAFRFFAVSGVHVVAAANNQSVTLPDNTTVILKKGATLDYPKHFAAAERHVSLKGEAFFEVTHNEAQPFVIDAQTADVKVLGTSFNVRCDEHGVDVAVATGRVQVSDHNNKENTVLLAKNEHAVLYEGNFVKDTVDAENYLYWKTGSLEFREAPLNEVIEAIAKATDSQIQLDDALPEARRQQAISISFHQQSVEEMLTEICLIAQCKWAKQNNTYIITVK